MNKQKFEKKEYNDLENFVSYHIKSIYVDTSDESLDLGLDKYDMNEYDKSSLENYDLNNSEVKNGLLGNIFTNFKKKFINKKDNKDKFEDIVSMDTSYSDIDGFISINFSTSTISSLNIIDNYIDNDSIISKDYDNESNNLTKSLSIYDECDPENLLISSEDQSESLLSSIMNSTLIEDNIDDNSDDNSDDISDDNSDNTSDDNSNDNSDDNSDDTSDNINIVFINDNNETVIDIDKLSEQYNIRDSNYFFESFDNLNNVNNIIPCKSKENLFLSIDDNFDIYNSDSTCLNYSVDQINYQHDNKNKEKLNNIGLLALSSIVILGSAWFI
jgi:hypothetical protein